MSEIFVTTQNKQEILTGKKAQAPQNNPDNAMQNNNVLLQKDNKKKDKKSAKKVAEEENRQHLTAFQNEYLLHENFDKKLQADYYNGTDSDQMKAVKSCMTSIGNLLGQEMSADKAQFEQQLRNLAAAYDSLLYACDQYLNKHHTMFGPNRRRKKLVKSVVKMAEIENTRIRDISNLNWLVENHKTGMLLGNVLGFRMHEAGTLRNGEYSNLRFKYDNTGRKDPDEKFKYEFSNQSNQIEWEAQSAVSTSRLAQFLGMDKSVMQCNLAIMKDRVGDTHYGYRYRGGFSKDDISMKRLMELANGNTRLRYTGESLRQINSIKLLNFLAGGEYADFEREIKLVYTARKEGGKTYVYVTGAYLDPLSRRFSASVDAKALRKGKGKLKKLESLDMPVIDDETAQKIVAMNEDDAKFIFGDILSKKQLAAFTSRLTYLKQLINDKKQDELDRTAFLKKEDWSKKENIGKLKAAIRSGNRHLPKGFFSEFSKIEGDTEEGEMEAEEVRYEALYKGLSETIDKEANVSDKLKTLSELEAACKNGAFGGDVFGGDADMIKKVAGRIRNEMMTADVLNTLFDERYAAAKKLLDDLNEEKGKDTQIPDSVYTAAMKDNDTLEAAADEWAAFKAISRHSEDYMNFLRLDDQIRSFQSGKNKSLDARLINPSDYIDTYKKTFLARNNKSSADFDKELSGARRIINSFGHYSYLGGQEITDAQTAIAKEQESRAVELLSRDYTDKLENFEQYRENLGNIKTAAKDKSARYWTDRRNAEIARQQEEERQRREEAERQKMLKEQADLKKAKDAALKNIDDDLDKIEKEEKEQVDAEVKQLEKEEADRKKTEEEAKKKADEEAKKKAEEEEAKRKADEEAKKKAEEEEAKRKADEEAKRKAEEEAKKLEEERKKAEEEAEKKEEVKKTEEVKKEDAKPKTAAKKKRKKLTEEEVAKQREENFKKRKKLLEDPAKRKNADEALDKLEKKVAQQKREQEEKDKKINWKELAGREMDKLKQRGLLVEDTKNCSIKTLKQSDEEGINARRIMDVVTKADDKFKQYPYLTHKEYVDLINKNPANKVGSPLNKIYGHVYDEKGEKVVTGSKAAYICNPNGSTLNRYIREKLSDKMKENVEYRFIDEGQKAYRVAKDMDQWIDAEEELIDALDEATTMGELEKDCRLVRMVDGKFLQYALKLNDTVEGKENTGSADELVKKINEKHGTIVKDDGFMSVGYQMDHCFDYCPIMLTILADKGTKCMATINQKEGELILSRNQRYMVVGAYAHGEEGKKVPFAGDPEIFAKENIAPTSDFRGLEVVVKLINEPEEEVTHNKAEEEEAKRKAEEEQAKRKAEEEAKKKAEEEEARKKEEAKEKAEEEKWDRIAKKELELAKKNNLFIKEVNKNTYYRKFSTKKDVKEGVITEIQDKYTAKYKVMDNATAQRIALNNPINDVNSKEFKTLYGRYNVWNNNSNMMDNIDNPEKKLAYISYSPGCRSVNEYLRAKYGKNPEAEIRQVYEKYRDKYKDTADRGIWADTFEKWKEEMERTIPVIEKAANSDRLSQDTRIFRMVDEQFLQYGLELDKNMKLTDRTAPGSMDDLVRAINDRAGKVIKDKGFMSCGYKPSQTFMNMCPIMLTILCEKGQKCFMTRNVPFAELDFNRNSRYMVLGARSYGDEGLPVPISGFDEEAQKKGAKYAAFHGLEIVVKMLRDDEDTDGEANKTEEAKKVEEVKNDVKKEENQNRIVAEFARLSQPGEAEKKRNEEEAEKKRKEEAEKKRKAEAEERKRKDALEDKKREEEAEKNRRKRKQFLEGAKKRKAADEALEKLEKKVKQQKKEQEEKDKKIDWKKLAMRDMDKLKKQGLIVEKTTNCSIKTVHQKDIATREARRSKDIITDADDKFRQYPYMSRKEFEDLMQKNPANKVGNPLSKVYPFLRGDDGKAHGTDSNASYIYNKNGSTLNRYIRDKLSGDVKKNIEFRFLDEGQKAVKVEDDIGKWINAEEELIDALDEATTKNELPRDCRLVRMVDGKFLQYALKLTDTVDGKEETGSADDLVAKINNMHGTIVKDDGFMSVGHRMDHVFDYCPIMLTILADKGTKCMATVNQKEGELILGRNQRYMVVGAYAHGEKGKKIPFAATESERKKNAIDPTCDFQGLEIVVKLINEPEETEEKQQEEAQAQKQEAPVQKKESQDKDTSSNIYLLTYNKNKARIEELIAKKADQKKIKTLQKSLEIDGERVWKYFTDSYLRDQEKEIEEAKKKYKDQGQDRIDSEIDAIRLKYGNLRVELTEKYYPRSKENVYLKVLKEETARRDAAIALENPGHGGIYIHRYSNLVLEPEKMDYFTAFSNIVGALKKEQIDSGNLDSLTWEDVYREACHHLAGKKWTDYDDKKKILDWSGITRDQLLSDKESSPYMKKMRELAENFFVIESGEKSAQKKEEEKWDRIAKKEFDLAKKNNLFIKEVKEKTYYKKFTTKVDITEGTVSEVQDQYTAKYKVMDTATAQRIALKNPINDVNSKEFKTLYGRYNVWDHDKDKLDNIDNPDKKLGYISHNSGCTSINEYLRAKYGKNPETEIRQVYEKYRDKYEDTADRGKWADTFEKWKEEMERTIPVIEKAANSDRLPQDTRIFRMVDEQFLQYGLELDKNMKLTDRTTPGSMDDLVRAINERAGKVIKDKGFMSSGYKPSAVFMNKCPIMLTILCEKGQKCFMTRNVPFAELDFNRDSRYMVLGARAYGDEGLTVPLSGFDEAVQKKGAKFTGHFHGLEIVVKMLKDDEDTDGKES